MNYIKGVANEMKKVTWPTLRETNRYTWTVIVMVIILSLYFALTDFAFDRLISWLVNLK
ncbi:preprotein translocase subunit SecE [Facklamia hominis]|uniref:Protein translocase subunit SecE n=2 Tax=Facklamia hominis TaxID=178214 RepID=K1LS26_9LACT|nr:preprotein translocase subunit SecE [Facklamia hominis]EKB54932.1 preprotein translocase, SecE subunit [Facklamia hominis CCUG 36813]EPH07577.1 preprotein translocase, SecE subunit [Facklamia hominis ACS-120-V-Sch10]MDK7187403.1 preprotein translocase subunit SecE [Facklamia hominis]PKY93949.1 preprotein translocase subunit SecE [Facklamia hominis]RYC98611.1 preprotein translocase subunit SecE [Facklamia hominis]